MPGPRARISPGRTGDQAAGGGRSRRGAAAAAEFWDRAAIFANHGLFHDGPISSWRILLADCEPPQAIQDIGRIRGRSPCLWQLHESPGGRILGGMTVAEFRPCKRIERTWCLPERFPGQYKN